MNRISHKLCPVNNFLGSKLNVLSPYAIFSFHGVSYFFGTVQYLVSVKLLPKITMTTLENSGGPKYLFYRSHTHIYIYAIFKNKKIKRQWGYEPGFIG